MYACKYVFLIQQERKNKEDAIFIKCPKSAQLTNIANTFVGKIWHFK